MPVCEILAEGKSFWRITTGERKVVRTEIEHTFLFHLGIFIPAVFLWDFFSVQQCMSIIVLKFRYMPSCSIYVQLQSLSYTVNLF
jgi:hypothetical protein